MDYLPLKSGKSKSNALGIFDSNAGKALVIGSYKDGVVSKDKIKNAMKWEMWNTWAKFNEISSTHPLISKRINAISARCAEFNQEPYIVFDLKKPESYIDDFFKELLICCLPIVSIVAFIIVSLTTRNMELTAGISGIVLMSSLFILLNKTCPNKNFNDATVESLLGEVKVSNVTAIPCYLEGEIIGRGNPGCIFNEDFVIKDETGIMFLDYNQPLNVLNKLFAIFKSKEYLGKKITVKGWYRRGKVPYVEIYHMEIDGKIKKCHTYATLRIIYWILLAISIGLMIYGIIGIM